MSEPEAIGEAVSGAMLGRAVEPKAGEIGADGHTHESACLNCGATLAGPFCTQCGQQAHVHRTLSAFFHDLLHGVLHFEGKVWRTLPLLAWKPGELTRRYIDGQRARFVSPMALFLFSVFLMFALGGITGGLTPVVDKPQIERGLGDEIARNEARIAVLEKDRDTALRAGQPVTAFDAKIADLKSETSVMRGLTTGDFVPERASVDATGLPSWLRAPLEKAAKNPELLFYKLRNNAYKYSWALIPISVPFVWLLFPFSRRFRLYDHTVFVTYSLCFMSLLAVTAMLMGAVRLGSLVGLLALLPPIHMYRQLKGAYGLTRFGALWRAMALTLFAFFAASLFIVAVAGIGFAA
jgi:hypothetical protein